MKKRVSKEQLYKKSALKAMPLAAAISLLSVGTAFAETTPTAPKYIEVQSDGGVTKIDMNLYNSNASYKAAVDNRLKAAFEAGQRIATTDDGTNWINFSEKTSEDNTYQNIHDARRAGDITTTQATQYLDADGHVKVLPVGY